MLLNTGQATKGMACRAFLHVENVTVLMIFALSFWSIIDFAAIEALEKSIKKREGVPFLWRLLVTSRILWAFSSIEALVFLHSFSTFFKAIVSLSTSRVENVVFFFFFWVQERAYSMIGSKEATIAGEKAKALESKYFK